ncbi:MAG: hypothetical protein IT544_04855, partial [Rhodobacteraceae bacterium]|nr:hypothetical protein [Paracoccaceae bacterium]
MLDVKIALGAFVVRRQTTCGLSGLRLWLMAGFLSLCASAVAAQSVVSVKSSTPDGSYKVGSSISIQVAFDQVVTVSGRPKLVLETGATDRTASYSGISADGRVLTFVYTVQADDSSSDLDYVSSTALSLKGGASIKDTTGRDVDLTLPKPGAVGSLAANKAISVGESGRSMVVYGSAAAAAVGGVAAVVAKVASGKKTDFTPPTLSIQDAPQVVGNKNGFVVTFVFSEAVSGFALEDITVVNGTVSNFATVDAAKYTVKITPDGNGNVEISVAAGVAQDAAGNGNTAATKVTVLYDGTGPTVKIEKAPPAVRNVSFDVDVVFSEVVTGFVHGDITVVNATVLSLTGSGKTYTAKIMPNGKGDVEISVAVNVAQDAVGNGNTALTKVTIPYDKEVPNVTFRGPKRVKKDVRFTLGVVIDEYTLDFLQNDVELENARYEKVYKKPKDLGDKLELNKSALELRMYYTFNLYIIPLAEGPVTAKVRAGAAWDPAGNQTAEAIFTTYCDVTPPTVSIDNAPPSVSTQAEFSIDIVFSEAVKDFLAGDVTVANGAVLSLTGQGKEYKAKIKPDGKGDLEINIAAGVAKDFVEYENTAANPVIVDYVTPMSVTIKDAPSSVSTLDGFPVTFEFSEAVKDFVLADITVTNGIVSDFATINSAKYTAKITPDGKGPVGINVAAEVAHDAAGNKSTAATPVTVTYSGPAVVATVKDVPQFVSSLDGFAVIIEFSEPVTGFTPDDIAVGNGNVSDLRSINATSFAAKITPNGQGDITIGLD